ncbi:MAG: hypothetical protein ACR2QE_17820, partial [Acidimicrobiales bacterium]
MSEDPPADRPAETAPPQIPPGTDPDPVEATGRIDTDPDRHGTGIWYEHALGRAALSGLIAMLVITLVGWNLPQSVFGYELRDESRDQLRPVVNRLAMNQGWEVFAPNPSSTTIAVTADVTFADGTTTVYEFP